MTDLGPDALVALGRELDDLERQMRVAHLAFLRVRPYLEEGVYDPWRPDAQAYINSRCSTHQIVTGHR